MVPDREGILQALFDRLEDALPEVDCVRRARNSSQINTYPAMDLTAGDESVQQTPRMPARWTLSAIVEITVNCMEDTGAAPDTSLNELLAKVDAALARQPDDPQGSTHTTLGGRVAHCWINRIDRGQLEGMAGARIEIEMLTA